MDAEMVFGTLTRVKDDQLTVSTEDFVGTYTTKLDQFRDRNWVAGALDRKIKCKVIDGEVVEIELY